MIAYSREEMVSVTDLLKTLRQTLDKISHNSVEKIAVMKNNRPEAVMLSVEEYERIKELADMAEHIGLSELIRERKATPKESYVPFEDVMVHREQLLKSAKEIAKSAKEEYDLLNE